MKTKYLTIIILAFIGMSNLNAQVGIGTTTPDASAALEVKSTDKGFLPPRLATAERDAISNPAEGLVIFNTDVDCIEFFTMNQWYNICSDGKSPNVSSTDVYNPVTGRVWMDRNLLANQVATDSLDVQSFGGHFQWGRDADGHADNEWIDQSTVNLTPEYDASVNGTPTSSDSSGKAWEGKFVINTGTDDWLDTPDDNLWDDSNSGGVNNPCPNGYRVPTIAEWEAEAETWTPRNAVGAINSPLKLPMAGDRDEFGISLPNSSSQNGGGYWSTTPANKPSVFNGRGAKNLGINDDEASVSLNERSVGLSVRCIKD